MDDDDLQELHFAMELERQREEEQRMLDNDPDYQLWLTQLEQSHEPG